MKREYTRKQIMESIKYWQKQLDDKNYINESINLPAIEQHSWNKLDQDNVDQVLNYALDLINIGINDMEQLDADNESSFTDKAKKFLKTIGFKK